LIGQEIRKNYHKGSNIDVVRYKQDIRGHVDPDACGGRGRKSSKKLAYNEVVQSEQINQALLNYLGFIRRFSTTPCGFSPCAKIPVLP